MDPLLAASEQAYTYAGGSPTNTTDPTGEVAGGFCVGLSGIFMGSGPIATICFMISSSGEYGGTFTPGGTMSPYVGFLNPLGCSMFAGPQFSIAANSLADLKGRFTGGGGSVGRVVEPLGAGVDVQGGFTPDNRFIDSWSGQVMVGESVAPAEAHIISGYTYTYSNKDVETDEMKVQIWWQHIPEMFMSAINPHNFQWPMRP